MATIDDIISRAQQVRDNTAVGSNTAPLVGGVMTDTAEHLKDAEEDITSLQETVAGQTEEIEALQGTLNAIDDEPTSGSNNLVKSGGVYQDVKIYDYLVVDAFLGLSGTTWSSGTGMMINVDGTREVEITAHSTNKSVYAFLTNDDILQPPAFVGGMSKAQNINVNSAITLNVPDDAKYLFVSMISGGTDRTPQSLSIDNLDINAHGISNLVLPLNKIKSDTSLFKYHFSPCSPSGGAWVDGFGLFIYIAPYASVKIQSQTSETAGYGFMTSDDVTQSPVFVKTMENIPANSEQTITIPNGSVWLYVLAGTRIPRSIIIDGIEFDSYKTSDVVELVNSVDKKVDETNIKFYKFLYHPVNVGMNLYGTTWLNGRGFFVKIAGRTEFTIKGNASTYTPYALLTSDDISQSPSFVAGVTAATSVAANTEVTVNVPLDAVWLYVDTYYQTDRTPQSLAIDGQNFDIDINGFTDFLQSEIEGNTSDITDIQNDIEDIQTEIHSGTRELDLVETTREYLNATTGAITEETIDNRWYLNKYDVTGLFGTVSGASTTSGNTAPWALYKNGVCVKVGTKDVLPFNEFLDGESYDTLYVQLRYPNMSIAVTFTDGTTSKVKELMGDVATLQTLHPLPTILLPKKFYAVVGTEFNLYYDAFVSCVDRELSGYSVNVICDVGKAYQYGFQYTPIAGDVGTHTFRVMVFNNNHEKLIEKDFSLIVIAATGLNTAKNILMIGDSTLDNPYVTPTVYDDFNGLTGTMPTFVGSKGSAPYKNCGYSGRSFGSFVSAGYTYYTFNVTGVDVLIVGDSYTDGTRTYRIVEVNVTDGVGYINTNLTSGTGERASSGTLTRTSGSGDATITYDGISESPSNPFWNIVTQGIDIAMYRTNIGLVGYLDLVSIRLGINDNFGNTMKTDTAINNQVNNCKTLIDAFLADNGSTKIVIELPNTCGNMRDCSANKGASQSYDIYQYNMMLLIGALIEAFDEGAYDANVTVCATGMGLDRYYGYPFSTKNVASRIPIQISVQSNMVHPSEDGYYQIADFEFPHFLNELS